MSSTPPDADLTSADVAEPGYLAQVVTAAETAAAGLAEGSPGEWRKEAYKVVLGGILQDAVDNGTAPPDEQDTGNLGGFVTAASTAALAAPFDLRDETFSVILQTLTDDWVVNWNAIPDDLIEIDEDVVVEVEDDDEGPDDED